MIKKRHKKLICKLLFYLWINKMSVNKITSLFRKKKYSHSNYSFRYYIRPMLQEMQFKLFFPKGH